MHKIQETTPYWATRRKSALIGANLPMSQDIDVILTQYDEVLGTLLDITPVGLIVRSDEPVEVFDQLILAAKKKYRERQIG